MSILVVTVSSLIYSGLPNVWLLFSFTWMLLHGIAVPIQSIPKTPVGMQTASKSVWRLESGACWLIFKLCTSL